MLVVEVVDLVILVVDLVELVELVVEALEDQEVPPVLEQQDLPTLAVVLEDMVKPIPDLFQFLIHIPTVVPVSSSSLTPRHKYLKNS